MRRWWKSKEVVLAAWLFALAAGGYVVYVRMGNNWTVVQQAPAPGDRSKRRQAVAALGRLEPQSEIINLGAGSPAPDRLESLLVGRGDLVKKGQVLGYLAGFAEQAAQLDVFKRQLEEAKLRQETGWAPRFGLDQTLSDTLDYWRGVERQLQR